MIRIKPLTEPFIFGIDHYAMQETTDPSRPEISPIIPEQPDIFPQKSPEIYPQKTGTEIAPGQLPFPEIEPKIYPEILPERSPQIHPPGIPS